MASAEKLKTGWRGIYYVHGVKCHTKAPHHPRKRDAIRAAEEARVRALREAARGDGTLSAGITWGQWWDVLREKRVFDESETGLTESKMAESYLRPQWGDTALNKITQKAVQDWIDALAAGDAPRNLKKPELAKAKPSPGYIARIYGVFTISINRALRHEVLGASPCVAIALPTVPKRPRPYLSVAGAETIGKHLRDDYRDAIDFGLETGLRPGELCGLHLDRIDLETGWMQVRDVYVRRLKVIRPCPKDEDVRLVALSDKAIEIVKRRAGAGHRAGCGAPHTDGERCGSDVLFRTARGRLMDQSNLAKHMHRASHTAGIAGRGAYAIRRGFATRAADGGLDAYELARTMGWSDINEAWAYVQRTPSARARVLAALHTGGVPELRLVSGGQGQSGTSSGTDLDLMPLEDTARVEARKAR